MGKSIEENNKDKKWINCAKFLAIFAVMVDHTNGILYANQNIAFASYYSVSLFIIISGMLAFGSNERHQLNWLHTFAHSAKSIVVTYLIANAFCLVMITGGFELNAYIRYVINFNLCGPFYYVLLYLQLMLVSRPLYCIVKYTPEKLHCLWEMAVGIVILCLCVWTTNYTNILDVYGGGGKLLGGTYLFLFYLGMLISKKKLLEHMTLKKSVVLSVAGVILWAGWYGFLCYNRLLLDKKLPFGDGFNPPGVTLSLFALITLVFACGIFSLFEYSGWLTHITGAFSCLGKHTLYIFLYHAWILECMEQNLAAYMGNIWLKRVVYITVMTFGPILLENIFHWVKKRMDIIDRRIRMT